MPRECPTCSNALRGDSCPSCGWSEVRPSNINVRDAMWGRCEDTRMGQRCAKAGSVSNDTSGAAGDSKWVRKWFCFDHAFPSSRGGQREAPRAGFRSIKELLT